MTSLLALLIPPAIIGVAWGADIALRRIRQARFAEHVDDALDVFADEPAIRPIPDPTRPIDEQATHWSALDEYQARRAMESGR